MAIDINRAQRIARLLHRLPARTAINGQNHRLLVYRDHDGNYVVNYCNEFSELPVVHEDLETALEKMLEILPTYTNKKS